MENKMDGVKISVNKQEPEAKPAKRRGRPKKVVAKAPAKISMAEARTSSQANKPTGEKKKSSRDKGSFMTTLIAVAVTAVVVGGSIYAWQNKNGEKTLTDVRQDARNVRMDFEQRLDQLKNKLTGVETENQQLKNSTKELEERVALLNGAKKDFSDVELGLSFQYPAIFGEVSLEMTDGVSGKKVKGSFSKNDKLSFGGVTTNYAPVASSTEVVFMETQGYLKKNNQYYFQPIAKNDSTDYEIKPSKEIASNGGVALLVDKNSFVAKEGVDGASVNIGENIGGLVNTAVGDFRGIAFENQDLGTFPMESYEDMLASLRISK